MDHHGAFDDLAALAARVFQVPIAFIGVVDEDRTSFLASHGLTIADGPRSASLWAPGGLDAAIHVVTDAQLDPAAATNPVMAGEGRLRFYAAAQLRTSGGRVIGTLTVADREPRNVTPEEEDILQRLAALVVREMEMRSAARRLEVVQAETRRLEASATAAVDEVADAFRAALLPARLPDIPGIDVATAHQPLHPSEIGGDFFDVFPIARSTWGVVIGDVCGKGPHAGAVSVTARHTLRAAALDHRSPGQVLTVLNNALLSEHVDEDADPRFCTVVYARLEARRWGYEATMACGGHPLPRVIDRRGNVERAGRPGMLVGCFADATFPEARCYLGAGYSMVLFTDGVTEARTASGEIGADGVDAILGRYGWRDAADIANYLTRMATPADSRPRDDVAVLALRIDSSGRRFRHTSSPSPLPRPDSRRPAPTGE